MSVGFDDSDGSRRALRWAAVEAARRGSRLAIVTAVRPLGTNETRWLAEAGLAPAQARRAAVAAAEKLLEEAKEHVRGDHPDLMVSGAVRVCDARELLLAESSRSDLVVVGSRGHGPLRSILLGSVGVALARHSAGPVAVIHPRTEEVTPRVVVGVEATRESSALVGFALAEASWRRLPLTVVSCRWAAEEDDHWIDWVAEDAEGLERVEAINRMLARARADYPDVEVEVRHTRGRADQCLIDLARDVDLLVVGRRTSTIVDQLGLGSMTGVVVELARGNVLVVPTAPSA